MTEHANTMAYLHSVNVRDSMNFLQDDDLINLVRDVLEARGIPHTIWDDSAIRSVAMDEYSGDITDGEMDEIIADVKLTESWRELSEPTDHHSLLLERALVEAGRIKRAREWRPQLVG